MSGKLLLFDFKCGTCSRVHAELVQSEQKEYQCPNCGNVSMRCIPCPRIDPRLGLDPASFPSMGDKWARKHEQGRKLDEAREREHGPAAWGSDGSDIRR